MARRGVGGFYGSGLSGRACVRLEVALGIPGAVAVDRQVSTVACSITLQNDLVRYRTGLGSYGDELWLRGKYLMQPYK